MEERKKREMKKEMEEMDRGKKSEPILHWKPLLRSVVDKILHFSSYHLNNNDSWGS